MFDVVIFIAEGRRKRWIYALPKSISVKMSATDLAVIWTLLTSSTFWTDNHYATHTSRFEQWNGNFNINMRILEMSVDEVLWTSLMTINWGRLWNSRHLKQKISFFPLTLQFLMICLIAIEKVKITRKYSECTSLLTTWSIKTKKVKLQILDSAMTKTCNNKGDNHMYFSQVKVHYGKSPFRVHYATHHSVGGVMVTKLLCHLT